MTLDETVPTRRDVLRLAAAAAATGCLPGMATRAQPAPSADVSQKAQAKDQARREELDARAAFFKEFKVPRLKIEIVPTNLEQLRNEPRQYVSAELTEDGGAIKYDPVGLKLRGAAGSFRGIDDDRPGFTLSIDKFKKGQTFHGMTKLSLLNCAQDPTFISEMMCGELYRAAGVPPARFTHAVVTLNDKSKQFYALKEGYDEGFFVHHFNNADGNFYDGGFLRDIDQDLEVEPGRNDPAKDRADLKALVAACNVPDDRRFDAIAKVLDVARFTTYTCLQALTCDWDGYPAKCNNYRIYHDPKPDKLVFIPSGMDQMFSDTGYPLLPDHGGMVARELFRSERGRKAYFARMKELTADVFTEQKLKGWIDGMKPRLQAAIGPVDEGLSNEVLGQVAEFRNRVKARAKNVVEQMKAHA